MRMIEIPNVAPRNIQPRNVEEVIRERMARKIAEQRRQLLSLRAQMEREQADRLRELKARLERTVRLMNLIEQAA